jgi:SAM-dependent methyltransferase
VSDNAQFDAFSNTYEEALESGLRFSGEDSHYYARERVAWLRRRLHEQAAPRAVLDFGCGTGSTAPLLRDDLGAERVIGVDPSTGLLERARAKYGSAGIQFAHPADVPHGWADLAYCNGVFHHIEPRERAESVRLIRDVLVPGGLFALWENNPWNPGTRFVMSRIAFDRDAVTLTPPETRRMLRSEGFAVVGTDSRFFFPGPLKVLRPLERSLTKLPLGGQYMVLARKAP